MYLAHLFHDDNLAFILIFDFLQHLLKHHWISHEQLFQYNIFF